MPRLPIPDQDANQWGTLLNEFLLVSHRKDGTSKGVTELVNVRDFGAKGNGATDDTQAMQAALNTVASSGGMVMIPAGTYLISAPLLIPSNTDLVGVGAASVIKRNGALNFPLLRNANAQIQPFDTSPPVLNNTNIRIAHLTLDGSRINTDWVNNEGGHLIWLTYVGDGAIENVWAMNSPWNGITLEFCQYMRITGCHLADNSKGGIYLSGSDHIIVTECTARTSGLNAISVSGSWFCTVSNNICDRNANYGITVGRDSRYSSIIGNFTDGIYLDANPIFATHLPFWHSHQPYGGATAPYQQNQLYPIQHCQIVGNMVSARHELGGFPSRGGVVVKRGSYNLIADNRIASMGGCGIFIHAGQNNTVRGNSISDVGLDGSIDYRWGILVTNWIESDGTYPHMNTTVEGNEIFDTRLGTTQGIYVVTRQGATGTVVRNNCIRVAPGTATYDQNGSNVTVTWSQNIDAFSAQGQSQLYLAAPPSTGAWHRGDIVFNNAPTAGGNVGWVCVADGTPGTWKVFGAIDPA